MANFSNFLSDMRGGRPGGFSGFGAGPYPGGQPLLTQSQFGGDEAFQQLRMQQMHDFAEKQQAVMGGMPQPQAQQYADQASQMTAQLNGQMPQQSMMQPNMLNPQAKPLDGMQGTLGGLNQLAGSIQPNPPALPMNTPQAPAPGQGGLSQMAAMSSPTAPVKGAALPAQ